VAVPGERTSAEASPEQLHTIDRLPRVHPFGSVAQTFETGAARNPEAGAAERKMGLLDDPGRTIAFVTFSAVVAGTPGPSNVLLTAIGARVGVLQGLVSLLGQVAGMGVMLFAVTLGVGNLLVDHPPALQVMRWVGAAILCWMAWRIATAAQARKTTGAPAGFLGMAAFQWVNPKGWLISIAAVPMFLDQRDGSALGQALFFAAVFTLIALPSCFPWLACGAGLQRFLRTPRLRRIFNWSMAALLAASVIVFLWSPF
jgi:threonine/homoserine/homoserine lactone efflux protein